MVGTIVPTFKECPQQISEKSILQNQRYLWKTSWRHFQDFDTLVPNNAEFFVCLSVCQLAYFLTEIRLMWGFIQFWMRYLSEIFWRLSWNKFTFNPNNSEFLVFLSVCQLAYFPTKIKLIWGYLQFWMRYLSEKFLETFPGYFWTLSKLF